jgi:hypothetical protein
MQVNASTVTVKLTWVKAEDHNWKGSQSEHPTDASVYFNMEKKCATLNQ